MSGPTYSYLQGAVQSAFTSYLDYDFTLPNPLPVAYTGQIYTLFWPISFQNSPNVVANFMKCTGNNLRQTDTNGFILPDATQVSVGTNFQIQNTTNQNISVYTQNSDSTTNLIATVEPEDVVEFLLTDTSTMAGIYSVFTFGVGTSAVIAANLAGEGLIATPDNKLNEDINIITIPLSTNEVTINAESRASFYLVQAGSGSVTFNLPDPGVVGNGFFFSVTNLGNGSITFNFGTTIPTPTLDNGNTPFIEPGRSASIITNNANWFTLGLGNSSPVLQVPSIVNISTATGGVYNLDPTEYNNQIIEFRGTLLSNVVVYFPAAAGIWYVKNSVTPAGFSLSLNLLNSTQTPISFPVGETLIVVSNGTTLSNYPSIVTPSAGYFGSGSAAAPSISFTENITTGAYLSGGQNFAITQNGNEVVEFSHTGGMTSTSNLIFPNNFNALIGATSVFGITPAGIQVNIGGSTDTPSLLWQAGLGFFKFTDNVLRLSANSIPLLEANGTTSAITILQNFQVDGTATFNSDITITGSFDITGNLTITGDLNVTQDILCDRILPTTPVLTLNGGSGGSYQNSAALFNGIAPSTTQGDLIVYNTQTNSRLGIGAHGRGLSSTGTLPAWSSYSTLQLQLNQAQTQVNVPFSNGVVLQTLNITPQYNNSKIKLEFSAASLSALGGYCWGQVKVNGTPLTGASQDALFLTENGSEFSFVYVHSPNSTAQQSYTFCAINASPPQPTTNVTYNCLTMIATEIGGF